jgi:hypothetical protein
MVSVTMNAGRRKDLGQPVQELQSGQAQGGAAGGIGLGEDVENLVRAAADQVEAVEGEGPPCTVADEPFQSLSVGRLDTDAGVQTEPTAVIPGEQILGLVGLQEAVAGKVAEHSLPDRVLETLQELASEGGGFMEAEAGLQILAPIPRTVFEEAIHDAQVEVVMGIEGGAEAMQETHSPKGG